MKRTEKIEEKEKQKITGTGVVSGKADIRKASAGHWFVVNLR